jgi:hypothetical protein
MMDVHGSHTYDAPIESVLSMLRNPDATVAKYEGMGHREVEILACEGNDERLRIESSRVVDVDLPGFARRVLKPTNTMRQVDEWHATADGGWDGTFDVEVRGAPLHLSGTMRLTPGPGTCTEDITVAIAVKVPLIGGKIADWAAKNDVQRSLDGEFAFNERWLAEHPA